MAAPIDVSTIVRLIEECRDKAESVVTNKETCGRLVDELEPIHDLLTKVSLTDLTNAEKYRLQIVLNRLYRITTRMKILLERCTSGKLLIKIRNFFSSTPIKEELQKLQRELPDVMGMLNLVFSIKRSSAYSRGPSALPPIDESIFDGEHEDDKIAAEDYYAEDED